MPGPVRAQASGHMGISASDCQYPGWPPDRARNGHVVAGLPGHAAGSSCTPALLGGLAGDAEPGADLGPGVAARTQALDGLGHGGVDLLGQAEHEGQGLEVAVPDAAAVGLRDAADERSVFVVLDLPSRTFRRQPGLDGVRPGELSFRDELSSWLTAWIGLAKRSCWASMAAAPFRLPGRGVEVPHPVAAGNRLEGQDCQGWRVRHRRRRRDRRERP
jgi:hypothetical protein